MGAIQQGLVDTVVVDTWPTLQRMEDFHLTPPYTLDTYAALVPRMMKLDYSPYEWWRS